MRNTRLAVLFAFIVAAAGCGGGGGGTTTPPPSSGPTPTTHPTGAPTPTPTPPGMTATPTASPTMAPTPTPPVVTPTPTATPTPGLPSLPSFVTTWTGFYGNTIANLGNSVSVRQMAFLPNGDLLVGEGGGGPSAPGTTANQIFIVPQADAPGAAGTPAVFATITNLDTTCQKWSVPSQTPSSGSAALPATTQGIAYAPSNGAAGGTIFVGTECGVYSMPYNTGDQSEASSSIKELVKVRVGGIADYADDQDVHHTTSVAVDPVGKFLYIGIGSSCNACAEVNVSAAPYNGGPSRAVVLQTSFTGTNAKVVAKQIRNPIALAVNPATQKVWAGGAGQDCVDTTPMAPQPNHSCLGQDPAYGNASGDTGHPYEFIDPVTAHTAPANYGWPNCEENNVVIVTGTNCSTMTVGRVRGPSYGTIIGATFYPTYGAAPPAYAFPSTFYGGLFFTMHGSWHETGSTPNVQVAKPLVTFVPMVAGSDTPANGGNWNGGAPTAQWTLMDGLAFVDNFQPTPGSDARVGRPAGITVGPNGSLFISDDQNGTIYRIRPGVMPTSTKYAPLMHEHRNIVPQALPHPAPRRR